MKQIDEQQNKTNREIKDCTESLHLLHRLLLLLLQNAFAQLQRNIAVQILILRVEHVIVQTTSLVNAAQRIRGHTEIDLRVMQIAYYWLQNRRE